MTADELVKAVTSWAQDQVDIVSRRVTFETAGRGCVVDGAVGLPPNFAAANSGGKDGWIVEAPTEET